MSWPKQQPFLLLSSPLRSGWLWLLPLLPPLLCLGSPGFLHPDELFQSAEPFQAAFASRWAAVPWEWAAEAPTRSLLPVVALVGAPLTAVAAAGGGAEAEVWAVRAVAAAGAAGAAAAAAALAAAHGIDGGVVRMLLATSWVATLMLGRPLSNATEAFALLALWTALAALRRALYGGGGGSSRSTATAAAAAAAAGALFAFSVFARFTFAVFAAPAIALVAGEALVVIWRGGPALRIAAAAAAAAALFALICSATALTVVDTVFFGGAADARGALRAVATAALGGGTTDLRLTPLNSARYNADPANLALHGLHPHWQHALVNGHVMFGPLWSLAAVWLGVQALAALTAAAWRPRDARHASPAPFTAGAPPDRQQLLLLAASTVIVSVAVLSLASHAEPRFLAPLVWPLAFIGADALAAAQSGKPVVGEDSDAISRPNGRRSRSSSNGSIRFCSRLHVGWLFWFAWLAFNTSLALLFGWFHQAHLPGATAALGEALRTAYITTRLPPPFSPSRYPQLIESVAGALRERAANASDVHVAYIGTYMVPLSVLGMPPADACDADGAAAVETAAARQPRWSLPAAPWAARGAGALARTVARGALISAAGEELPCSATGAGASTRLHVHEVGSAAAALDVMEAAAAAAAKLGAAALPAMLLVYPSTLRGSLAAALAARPAAGALRELHAVAPHLSMEHPPASADEWLALGLPASAARAALARGLGGGDAPPAEAPALVFAMLARV